ncbi:MAG: hypothetical protein ACXV3C_05260 [Actinomycetes bacterium]
MSDVRFARPSRRGVLAGGAALLVAACSRAGGAEQPPGPTPDQRLAARAADEIRLLAAAYAATIARHPGTRPVLGRLAAEHEAHVAALVAVLPTPSPGSSASADPSPSPTATPAAPVPSAPAAASAALAAAERSAAARRRGQAGRAGPELARLLASIGACEAVHAVLLGGGT